MAVTITADPQVGPDERRSQAARRSPTSHDSSGSSTPQKTGSDGKAGNRACPHEAQIPVLAWRGPRGSRAEANGTHRSGCRRVGVPDGEADLAHNPGGALRVQGGVPFPAAVTSSPYRRAAKVHGVVVGDRPEGRDDVTRIRRCTGRPAVVTVSSGMAADPWWVEQADRKAKRAPGRRRSSSSRIVRRPSASSMPPLTGVRSSVVPWAGDVEPGVRRHAGEDGLPLSRPARSGVLRRGRPASGFPPPRGHPAACCPGGVGHGHDQGRRGYLVCGRLAGPGRGQGAQSGDVHRLGPVNDCLGFRLAVTGSGM